ncbi:MAG: sugar-binding protein, partial [Thermoplasmatota archaeon]
MYQKVVIAIFLLSLLPVAADACEGPGPMIREQGEEKRWAEAYYSFEPPVLDGRIGAMEWQTEFTTNYFDAFDGQSFREIYPAVGSDEEFTDQADLAITFYLLYDDTFLYFAANVTDQSIVVDSGTTFWRDDGVELLVDGAHDMDEDQRAGDPWPGFEDGTTLLAKADGSYFYDYSNSTPYERFFGENKEWFAASRTTPSENYYIVEMRVRLDSIASPEPGGTIGFNVGINDDDTGDLSKTALKWTGRETTPEESPTFKNESLWGIAHLRTHVEARLPERIEVDEDTEVEISADDSTGNHPEFETGANFTWTLPMYIGDGWNNLTRYGSDFVHIFEEPLSFYTLMMEVRDPSGASDTAVTRIYVKDVTPPVIEYSDATALEERPFTYAINATDNVGVSRVEWSLMDNGWYNQTTKATFFDHIFEHPGIYMLHFSVLDEENNTANGTARITVLDDAPPVIEGPIPDLQMNTSQTVVLTAPAAYDDTAEGPSTNLSFAWSFSGKFGLYQFLGRTVNVTLDIPGDYNGTLMVTDGIGLSSFLTFNASVHDDTPPVPGFFLPLEVGELRELELNASGSLDNDPLFWNGSSFTWVVVLQGKETFMDTLEGPMNMIAFPFPGTAIVTLYFEDPSGNTANLTKQVRVLDMTPPHAVLTMDGNTIDQNEPIFLNITGSQDNEGLLSAHYTVFRIEEGGEIPFLSTPFFGVRLLNVSNEDFRQLDGLWITLSDPGIYRIDMILMDTSGLNDTVSLNFTVRDSTPPRALMNRTIVYLTVGDTLYLSGSGSSDKE